MNVGSVTCTLRKKGVYSPIVHSITLVVRKWRPKLLRLVHLHVVAGSIECMGRSAFRLETSRLSPALPTKMCLGRREFMFNQHSSCTLVEQTKSHKCRSVTPDMDMDVCGGGGLSVYRGVVCKSLCTDERVLDGKDLSKISRQATVWNTPFSTDHS